MTLGLPSSVLGLLIVLFQTALIYFQNFTPFEREINLRAVLWGAKPAPRYWFVLALDVLTGLLLALCILSILPMSPRDDPLARALRFTPMWIGVSLLVAILHSYLTQTIIRFPNYGLIARRMIIAAILAFAVVAMTLLMISVAMTADYDSALGFWSQYAPVIFLPAYLLALVIFALRALAFVLCVLPVVGSFLHAAVSTF